MASPENLPSLTTPDKYRPFAPGSPPVQVSVPHARPETTFDIKYYTRERRRVHAPALNLGGTKLEEFVVKPAAPMAAPFAAAGIRADIQNSHQKGSKVAVVPLTDEENGGYT
jgi:hypothetical protein